MSDTSREYAARQRKVAMYAAHFFVAGIHSSHVAAMGLKHPAWCQLAKALRIQPPHSEATITGILETLRAFEGAREQQEQEQGEVAFDLTEVK